MAGRSVGQDLARGFYDLITKVDFETIDDLEETFEFLLRLPIQMNTFMLAEMITVIAPKDD